MTTFKGMDLRSSTARAKQAAGTAQPDALAAVAQMNALAFETTLRAVPGPGGKPVADLTTLLAILTYCYARQTYSSAEIAAVCQGDGGLCAVCANQACDPSTLRRFRRENREALELCLKRTLQFLAEQKVAMGMVTRVCQAQLTEEARRRVIMAMFLDSMKLDGDGASDAPLELCYLFAERGGRVH